MAPGAASGIRMAGPPRVSGTSCVCVLVPGVGSLFALSPGIPESRGGEAMRLGIRPTARDFRAFLVLLLVAALAASAGWAQNRPSRDRINIKFFLLQDGRLTVSGYAGAGEVVTVTSGRDGQVCSFPTRGEIGWWLCRAEVKGRSFLVRSTGGGGRLVRNRNQPFRPRWLPAEPTTPLARVRHVDPLHIGRTALRRGRLAIRGRGARGNRITVSAADGRELCSAVVGRSRTWRCSARRVSPGTFVVRSSGGASATITR